MSLAPVILLVEDNPITRKMMRFALEAEGYDVVDAADGRAALEMSATRRPDLLVLDYALPDMDGLQLLEEVRRKAAVPELPAIVVTGMVSRLEELRARGGAYTQFLAKPVAPSRLVEIVGSHLAAPERPVPPGSPPPAPSGRRILVIDDEPLNRKLVSFRLKQAGYEVETASGGPEGLELARRRPPDAILTDILMPSMDGFSFCREVRRDPALAAIPIVLLSSAYVDEGDRELSRSVGANDLVVRTPDLRDATEALGAALRGAGASPPRVSDERVAALHQERLQVQLERQTARNEALLRQAAIQAAALSVVRGLSEVLAEPKGVTQILGDVLVHCLDAAGLSTGLLYVAEPGGRHRLQAQFGIAADRRADAEACFGKLEMIRRIVEGRQPVAFSSSAEATDEESRDFLARLGYSSALVMPFVVLGETYGELVLASDSLDLTESAWSAFARGLALQFGQTVALGQSLKRLADSEERYRLLFESNPHPMWVHDQQTFAFLVVNEAAVRHYGYTREEFLAMTALELWPRDGDLEAFAKEYDGYLAQQGPTSYATPHTFKHRKKDGAIIEVDIAANPIVFEGRRAWLLLATDVTERRTLEAQLLQSQKMESMGRLAGGVAHDFNNLLGIITGYGELLRRRVASDPRLTRYVDDIVKAAERGGGLTRQLLAFSRKQVLQPRILDLNAVVDETQKMLQRLIGEDVQLVTVLDETLGPVKADPGQIGQILMNLAVNARDAMPRGGRLTIETGNVGLDESYARQHAGVEPGRYVMLAVSDTGHGMTPEVRSRLFEPFFTTKEPGKGTGLGLATVYGIVKQSGGHIFVYSEPGHGTSFKVYLPRTDAVEVAAPLPEPTAGQLPRGWETILLVEDETSLRELIRECLEDTGYAVLEAQHGTEALELCERYEGPIHLLVTDVVMPRMGGRELGERIRALRPDLRVLYMSGYTDDAVVLHGVLAEDMAFLQKPFTVEALALKVRELLDQPAGKSLEAV